MVYSGGFWAPLSPTYPLGEKFTLESGLIIETCCSSAPWLEPHFSHRAVHCSPFAPQTRLHCGRAGVFAAGFEDITCQMVSGALTVQGPVLSAQSFRDFHLDKSPMG